MITSSPAIAAPLLSTYAPPAGAYDETLDERGQLRDPWKPFFSRLDDLGRLELARRWESAQGLLRENGIAFSAYGDPRDRLRPWTPDALPLLIPSGQWERIAAALVQRAELLDKVLADLFGPQQLLARGLIPAELVFAHPGFLPPLHGQPPRAGAILQQYAADLARGPDGAWRVLADRTEAPSGTGYTLENRIVISRMFSDVFHASQVERLAAYFIALRETLASLAPQHRDNPRIVLLSQGPASPNQFEDAYMARYLGYTLVEEGDLAVRGSQVLLKTLGGLLPVDVILRRPNTEHCDPLELASEGAQGPAGLLQAVRAGKVAVANTLGAGLVESPALVPYLPRLCRELRGEELAMPNLATWWCGDRASLDYVLRHLDELTIRPAHRRRGQSTQAHRQLHALDRGALAAAIRAQPAAYVAQEQILRSTMPVWSDGEIKAGHLAVRAFLVASGASYHVLPGGLTRVSATSEPLERSILAGERSKDTWILSDLPVRQVSLLQQGAQAIQLRRGGAELPSRVADNLFWLGRHIERADAGARLLRTTLTRLTSELSSSMLLEMPALLRALVEQGQIEPGFVVEGMRDPLPEIDRVLPACALDGTQPGSLRSMVLSLFLTAGKVRDRISIDSWRIVRRIDQQLRWLPPPPQVEMSDLLSVLDTIIIDLAAFSGLVMESMTRTQAWRFLDLGRRLERALQTIYLVRSVLAEWSEHSSPLLDALLEVADSLMTYRSRYLANLQLAAVLDLLLTDETNPRSLAYQLVMLEQHVAELPRPRGQPMLAAEQRLALSLLHDIRMGDVLQLAQGYAQGNAGELDRLLTGLAERLPLLAEAISHKYLVHAGPSHQLEDIRSEPT